MDGIMTYPTQPEAPVATPRAAKATMRRARPASGRKPRPLAPTRAGGKKRQKAMMALIPILALTLVFLLKNPLKMSSAASARGSLPAIPGGAVISAVEIAWEIPPLYPADSRDPMQLPAPPAPPSGEPAADKAQTRVALMVKGILYSADRPAAVVDTHIVREGQQIAGATVRKIERDGVVFELDGRTWKQAVDK